MNNFDGRYGDLYFRSLYWFFSCLQKFSSIDALEKCCSDGGRECRVNLSRHDGVRDVRNAINRRPLVTTSIERVSWLHIDSSISLSRGNIIQPSKLLLAQLVAPPWGRRNSEDRLRCSSIDIVDENKKSYPRW